MDYYSPIFDYTTLNLNQQKTFLRIYTNWKETSDFKKPTIHDIRILFKNVDLDYINDESFKLFDLLINEVKQPKSIVISRESLAVAYIIKAKIFLNILEEKSLKNIINTKLEYFYINKEPEIPLFKDFFEKYFNLLININNVSTTLNIDKKQYLRYLMIYLKITTIFLIVTLIFIYMEKLEKIIIMIWKIFIIHVEVII
jgi:hypothetical protein